MEDAEGASSSRQPDDPDSVSGEATDDPGATPLPPDVDLSDEISVPSGMRRVDDVTIEAAPSGADPSEEVDADADADPDDAEPAPEAAEDPDLDAVTVRAADLGLQTGAADDDAGEPPAQRRRVLPTTEPARSRLIAGGAIGAVAVLAVLGALIGGGGDGPDTAAPVTDPAAVGTTEPAVAVPTPTSAPVATQEPVPSPTTDPPSTTPASEAPASSQVTTTDAVGASATTLLPDPSATTTSVPGGAELVGRVVPDVAAYPEALDAVAQAQRIAELAATARNDVASPGPVGSLCAVVRLQEQAQLAGRWERDGDEVDATNLSTVGEPGFGDCLVGEDGSPLEEGTYQFIVADRDGNDSAAGTFVVGAVPLEQIFVNTSTEQVCVLRLAPSSAARYDAYDFAAEPLVPGASVIVPIADVDHEVRVDGCDPATDPIAEFDFNPAAGVPQPLMD